MAPEIWSATDNFLSCPFTPQQHIKLKFRKNLKNGGDITILHMYTINVNHVMHGSWDMKHEVQDFLSFWAIFYPFTHLTTHKMEILKKWKKTPEDTIILHMCTINDIHMMYGSWDMAHDKQLNVILGHFLPFYPTKTLKNQNLQKMKKMLGDIII